MYSFKKDLITKKESLGANNIPVLDSLRAIAAIAVCFFHFVVGPINFVKDETVLNFFGYGKYGVQLFFVISGFIIPWSLSFKKYEIKSFFKFLIKRLVRLEPPYLFSIVLVLLLYILRYYLLNDVDTRSFSVKQVMLHIGYLIPFFENYHWINEVYWTLAIEFQFYIFIGLVYFVISSSNFILRLISFTTLLLLHFVGSDHFLLYWLPVFLLGNMLFLIKKGIIEQKEFYILSMICLVFIFVFMGIPVFVSSLIPVVVIMYFEKFDSIVGSWLGKISYSIYLVHTIVGSAVINVLSHHVSSSLGIFLVILVGVIFTILFSYITYLLVEKKSQKYSNQITY